MNRISKKQLKTQISNINYYTEHKIDIFFTQGCGIILTLDEKEYKFKTNKEADNFLEPYWEKMRQNVLRNRGGFKNG